jgi:heat-inducible transcriptional repressor
VITAPKKPSVFHHIEFMRLSERRVLVILVAPDGDVQNRVIFTAHDYTAAQLLEASNFLTAHYAGLTLEEVRERLKTEVDALRGEISALMHAAVQAGSEAIAESHEQVVIAGERNLLAIQDFSSDMGSLRKLFDLFEQKTQLMRLLEVSSRADGVASSSAARAWSSRRGALGRLGAVRGRRPGRRHARRDRADADGVQTG